ncbi:hypothetical protein [Caudoviricetes sp.]|nr:hypothetical protein [Caudoviricetes sp.]
MAPDEIQRSLGRIEGTLEGMASDMTSIKEAALADRKRIGSLELWRSFLAGAWFVTSALLVYLFKDK